MRFQKVKMVLNFIVPTDPQQYGIRNTDASWKTYAEHDMQQYLKDVEEIPEEYVYTVRLGDISFDWLEEFESQGKEMPHEGPKEESQMATTQQKGETKDKALTGDAGAHYVAFRLAAMGYAVGLTTHGTRAIDLLVANPKTGKSVTVQTKTMRDASVQSKTYGPYSKWRVGTTARPVHKTFLYAFVDLKGGEPKTPDVYIVPSSRLATLLEKYPKGPEKDPVDVWCSIDEKDAKEYKEHWGTIESALE